MFSKIFTWTGKPIFDTSGINESWNKVKIELKLLTIINDYQQDENTVQVKMISPGHFVFCLSVHCPVSR